MAQSTSTMILQASASSAKAAYGRLHPEVQAWIRDQGWKTLHPLQVQAINAILGGCGDLLITAPTAAGKTEAAILPVVTAVADQQRNGFAVLYVSPLKALINDQARRLSPLCDRLGLTLVPWHGDAGRGAKTRAFANPSGMALITPESLEALLVRRPEDARRLMSCLAFIVIDELHALMSGPRGLHLASLLKRIDAWSRTPARRIGLSATIGDLARAAAWLRPTAPSSVTVAQGDTSATEVMLKVMGYLDAAPAESRKTKAVGGPMASHPRIADHLFQTLRGSSNLVFAQTRREVESIADSLRTRSARAHVPNEFFAHHGSLSKEIRSEVEDRLRQNSLPTTVVCTQTLELGIDIGSVSAVSQIGAPRSISSLRQRLGRAGRRGAPAILRLYIREPVIDHCSDLQDRLRPNTVRAVASVRLLQARFAEPAPVSTALATALLHQILSVITERLGATPRTIFNLLAGPGPFEDIGPEDLVELLNAAIQGPGKLIEVAADGSLMLGEGGEAIVSRRDFFSMFQSDLEWRVLSGQVPLGTIPLSNPVAKGTLILFAGRHWIVEAVDTRSRILQVAPHQGGAAPQFDAGAAEDLHDRLLEEMRAVYSSDDVPEYLDTQAQHFLSEARRAFSLYGLAETRVVAANGGVHLFPWRGSGACHVFAAALRNERVKAQANDLAIFTADASLDQIAAALHRIRCYGAMDLDDLSLWSEGFANAKYDTLIPRPLLHRLWMRRNRQAITAVPAIAADLLKSFAR